MEDYYARPELSNSKLSEFKRQLDGSKKPPITQKSADLGHLFHTGLFEPHLYQETIDRVRERVTDKEIRLIEAMQAAAKKNHSLLFFLNHPKATFETEYYGDLHGIPFKMKADAVIPNAFGDGKSTAAKTLDQFLKSCDDYGYWRQAVIYKYLGKRDKMVFWGVSKAYPHNTFYVDVAQYPEQMAAAELEVENLCKAWVTEREKALVDEKYAQELLTILKSYEYSF